MQEQEGEDRIVAKSKADEDEPRLHCLDKFFDCTDSGFVEKSGDIQSTLSNRLVKYRNTWRKRINRDAASSSQGWQKRCSSGCRYEETRRDRRRPRTPEFPWRFNKYEETRRFRKLRHRRWRWNLATQSPPINKYVPHLEKVFSVLRQRDGLGPMDQMKHLAVTLQAAVHLGKTIQNFYDPPRTNRNLWGSYFKWLRRWSRTRQKLLDWKRLRETTLLTDRAVQFATAKTYVFSDPVLSLGGISTEPVKAWVRKIKWFSENSFFLKKKIGSDRRWADGVRVEKFPRLHYIGNSRRDFKDDDWIKVWTWALQRKDHLHANVQWHWLGKTRKQRKLYGECRVTEYARRFTRGSFLRPGTEKKWYETHVNKPDGEWDKNAEDMMLNFPESGHPKFRATVALERGELKSKGKGVKSIHFNGSDDTIELILRTSCFCQSAQCLRSSSGFVWRISQRLTRYGDTRREGEFRING